MNPVSFDKRGQILLPQSCKILAVIAGTFRHSPCIKSLVKNIHSQSVTGLHKCSGWRIVCGSDCIEAGFLKLPYLSFLTLI